MLKKFLFLSLSVLLAACAASPTPIPTPSAEQIEAEQEAVYAALLLKLYPAPNYVIMDTTATSPTGVDATSDSLQHALQNMHDVSAETSAGFTRRNDSAYTLQPTMQLGASYVLLTEDQRSQIFGQNQDGWQVFYEQYPDAPGIIELSQVGFNSTFDQALVYVGDQVHWLAGAGYFVLLNKVNGTWSVDQQVMTWIS